jgi:hypothetical protein
MNPLVARVNPRLSDLELLDKWTEITLESYWKELVYEAQHANDTGSGYVADDEATTDTIDGYSSC